MTAKALPRILPFLIFMLFIGVEELIVFLNGTSDLSFAKQHLPYLYPVKVAVVTGVLIYFQKTYEEINWKELTRLKESLISIFSGLLVFILWINLDFSFATQGTPGGFAPAGFEEDAVKFAMITVRVAGAVLLVPVMEELFWRSFLLRFAISSEFSKIPIGRFSWASFAATSILFGLEHHYILAGIVAGVIFNLLVYYTRSIAQCILSHAVANFALASYVLMSGEWRFW